MRKTILLTGATDGIGLETAGMLVSMGHHVLLHGHNPAKLREVESTLSTSKVTRISRLTRVNASYAHAAFVPAMRCKEHSH